jgi:membrane protease YdiL (CAAX protease family)
MSDALSEPVSKAKFNKRAAAGAPKKDLGNPAWLVVKTLVIFLASQVIASFVVVFFLALQDPSADPSQLLNNSIAAQFFYVLIAELLAVACVFAILRYRNMTLSFIGLGRKPMPADFWRAAVGFVVFYGLLIVASILVSILLPSVNTDQKQQLGFNNIVSTGDNILALFALVLLPPLGEELLVRGYLFSGLRARLRFWPAALLTSVLFGVAHLEFGTGEPLLWAAAVDTFVLSIVLVYLRESTGALYAGMLVHLLNNLVAFSVHFK